jgi:dolichol-phosphate mannosyltransferase
MDADGSHQPEELGSLLAAADRADLVLGTRWMAGGSVVNWPLSRRLISRFGTKYASIALGLQYRDLTSGFRVLSRKAVEAIFAAEITTIGYGFQIEIVRIAASNNLMIAEVPITFIERVAGNSKMSRKIVIEAWRKTTIWGLQRIVNRR